MDDGQQLTVPRSSVEKLEEQLDRLTAAKPEGTAERLLLTTFKTMLPTLKRSGFIPDDPLELDANLELLSQWALSMRSDGATDMHVPQPALEA